MPPSSSSSTPHSEIRTPDSPSRLPHWGWLLLATVLLVIAAVGLSIWVPYQREQALVAQIARWGGASIVEPGGPVWLRKRLGDERMKRFVRVSQVHLNSSSINDEEMAYFNRLPRIDLLNLTRTSVGDAGIANVRGLKTLTHLWLGDTQITDAGVVHIAGLTGLTDVSLEGTNVSDASIPHLSKLINLTWLNLYRTRITEEGLQTLCKALPACKIEL
jgi:Leucine-rich repeat (LRR) protein